MITYKITKSNMWDNDNENYKSFGVCAYEILNNDKKLVAYITDIFLNRQKAENLVDETYL